MPVELGTLTQLDVFEGLSAEQLQQIAAIGHEERYHRGEVIFRENTVGDSMYVVLDGEVEIQVDPSILGEEFPGGSTPTSITVIRRGQNFGEVALVDQGVRSASAICRKSARLLAVPRREFLDLCQRDLAMGYRVMTNIAADLAGRIRTTDFLLRGRLLLAPRGQK